MPWKESRASDERPKFIAEVLCGDSTITDLGRRLGISCLMSRGWLEQQDRIRFGAWILKGPSNAATESAATHSRSPMRSAA